jgi:Na+-transporting NADH:ubiquinone oxidoreductase subunit C
MKIKKDSNLYTFGFALLICVVCSFSLAAVSEGLRSRKELNMANDARKNILKAVALKNPLPGRARPREVLNVFQQKIEEAVIDGQGRVVAGKKPGAIQAGEDLYPLYIYKEGGAVVAYAFPVEGKGLWSTLYGYLAIEADGQTVRGITFYKHGETPGLGGEIEKAWFQDNFKGKKIWDAAARDMLPLSVVKGRVKDKVPAGRQAFYVDGISGATMTCQGVSELLARWLKVYEPFLKTRRQS